ncbi:MAG: LUD domain-containing protein [Bacteroidia bacterium]|nr:lactate utilization protein [Bacteroidia bacterium]NNC86348.1 LUD domain-containing protein [Bacteroidia bacterium]NNM15651.1 LUD domain-containing protein [Bacteroidia bacterium]
MQDQSNREKVLKAIRNGLLDKTEAPFHENYLHKQVFKTIEEDIDLHFATQFTAAGGKFIFCQNELEFAEKLVDLSQHKNWKQVMCIEPVLKSFLQECEIPFIDQTAEIEKPEVFVSSCESLIARHGSILTSSTQMIDELLWQQAKVHIVLAYNRQVVTDYKEALNMAQSNHPTQRSDQFTFINGPAKCQNYDPALDLKGIGPEELYLFLIESENPNEQK